MMDATAFKHRQAHLGIVCASLERISPRRTTLIIFHSVVTLSAAFISLTRTERGPIGYILMRLGHKEGFHCLRVHLAGANIIVGLGGVDIIAGVPRVIFHRFDDGFFRVETISCPEESSVCVNADHLGGSVHRRGAIEVVVPDSDLLGMLCTDPDRLKLYPCTLGDF